MLTKISPRYGADVWKSYELNYVHINLDDYIEENRGTFVDYVDYDVVQKRVSKGKEPILIEGVCLLAVLEELQLNLDLLIYVKRINDSGVWGDEDDCDVVGDIDELMAETKQRPMIMIAVWEDNEIDPDDVHKYPKLHEEIIRYHHRFRPQDKADIIYKRMV